jgi:hypothetical protein
LWAVVKDMGLDVMSFHEIVIDETICTFDVGTAVTLETRFLVEEFDLGVGEVSGVGFVAIEVVVDHEALSEVLVSFLFLFFIS